MCWRENEDSSSVANGLVLGVKTRDWFFRGGNSVRIGCQFCKLEVESSILSRSTKFQIGEEPIGRGGSLQNFGYLCTFAGSNPVSPAKSTIIVLY